ncbi:MAG: nucleotidyltransferase domain-containing protein [Bacteroidetes bacterium]|nr:nucleotidyltransferase domain-containing protein [Bacteroidota bacterium]
MKPVADISELLVVLKSRENELRAFGAHKLGVFGSFVRSDQTGISDIDFLVEFVKGEKTYKNFIGLCFFLEKITGREVDLLTPESLPKDREFTRNVLNEVKYYVTFNA